MRGSVPRARFECVLRISGGERSVRIVGHRTHTSRTPRRQPCLGTTRPQSPVRHHLGHRYPHVTWSSHGSPPNDQLSSRGLRVRSPAPGAIDRTTSTSTDAQRLVRNDEGRPERRPCPERMTRFELATLTLARPWTTSTCRSRGSREHATRNARATNPPTSAAPRNQDCAWRSNGLEWHPEVAPLVMVLSSAASSGRVSSLTIHGSAVNQSSLSALAVQPRSPKAIPAKNRSPPLDSRSPTSGECQPPTGPRNSPRTNPGTPRPRVNHKNDLQERSLVSLASVPASHLFRAPESSSAFMQHLLSGRLSTSCSSKDLRNESTSRKPHLASTCSARQVHTRGYVPYSGRSR